MGAVDADRVSECGTEIHFAFGCTSKDADRGSKCVTEIYIDGGRRPRARSIFERQSTKALLPPNRKSGAAARNLRQKLRTVQDVYKDNHGVYSRLRCSEEEADAGVHASHNGNQDGNQDGTCGGYQDWEVTLQCANTFVTVVVFVNMIVLGLDTSLPDLWYWNIVEHILLLLYAVGFLVKCCALYRMRCPEKRSCSDISFRDALDFWDGFDLAIIVLGAVDICLNLILLRYPFQNAQNRHYLDSFMHVVKVLRVVRLLRLTVLVHDLRVLSFSCVLGVRALGWACLLLLLFLYVSAVFLVKTVGRVPEDDKDYETFHKHFGTIWSAMVTLFELTVDPDLEPFDMLLWPPRPILSCFLFLFVMVGTYGFMAVLNGVVAENISTKNRVLDTQKHEEFVERMQEICKIAEFLFGPESDPRTKCTFDELEKELPNLIHILQDYPGFEYAKEDVIRMLEMLSLSEENEIDRDDFIYFLTQLAHGIRPMLLMEVFYESVLARKQIQLYGDGIFEKLDKFEQRFTQFQTQILEFQTQTQDELSEIRQMFAKFISR